MRAILEEIEMMPKTRTVVLRITEDSSIAQIVVIVSRWLRMTLVNMQCEACFTRFHLKPWCNIDTAKYEALEENGLLSVIRWFCKKCDKVIMLLASELLDKEERLTTLENRSDVKAIVKEVLQDLLKDEAEIEKRKLNVIVQGLSEPALKAKYQDCETRPTTGEERGEKLT